MADKEAKVYLAKLAEQAERYDEMADFMKVSWKCIELHLCNFNFSNSNPLIII